MKMVALMGCDWLDRAEMQFLGEVRSMFKCVIMIWIALGYSHFEISCHITCGGNAGSTRDYADVIRLFLGALA